VNIQAQIDSDIKAALLAGDKQKAETLKGVKSALLNEMISLGAREHGLTDDQVQKVLARESKKRAEAVDLYQKAGAVDRAQAEAAEKAIIDAYLPAQLSEAEITAKVKQEVAKLDNPTMADMGRLTGSVKAALGPQADGAVIARLVKASLEQQ